MGSTGIEFSPTFASAEKSHQRPTRAKRVDLAIIPYETPGCYIIRQSIRDKREDIHFGDANNLENGES